VVEAYLGSAGDDGAAGDDDSVSSAGETSRP
jgi:hypothetical protein